jgi:hypothetical protein
MLVMANINGVRAPQGKKMLIGMYFVSAFFIGCASRSPSTEATAAESETQVEAEPAPPQVKVAGRSVAPTPAPATPAASQGIGPGMNANGDVIDSSKVASGYGRKVKGIGDWEGEITGNTVPNSRFNKLQIGMPMRQVLALIGAPTDHGGYVTGKRFIPFYYGSDRRRYELAYKGQGRLIFAGGAIGERTPGNLIWIIHNANDSGYR